MMIWSVAELIEYISTVITLDPGDLVITGLTTDEVRVSAAAQEVVVALRGGLNRKLLRLPMAYFVAPGISALKFGAPEYFSLMLMALIAAACLAHGDMVKSLAMVFMGLLFGGGFDGIGEGIGAIGEGLGEGIGSIGEGFGDMLGGIRQVIDIVDRAARVDRHGRDRSVAGERSGDGRTGGGTHVPPCDADVVGRHLR